MEGKKRNVYDLEMLVSLSICVGATDFLFITWRASI